MHRSLLLLTLTASLLLAGCATEPRTSGAGTDEQQDDSSTEDTGSMESEDSEQTAEGSASEDSEAAATVEAAGPTPRLAVTYDGGVLVLDALSLEVEGDLEAEGFTRLNPAGDGRHLFLTEGDAFRLLDAGTWSEPHGNHNHSYTTAPAVTGLAAEGSHPGHVVRHAGTTALYFDGAGRIDLVDPTELDATAAELPVTESIEVADPHHGVAVRLEDGSLLETVGTEEERTGARVLDADGEEVATTDECPGVHGETVAEGEAVVLGCEDGPVVYADGSFTKVASPDDYGRVGNVAGTELSHVVLGDYKVDEDAELERPERVSLTDTETGEMQLVDLGTSYSFRSLARGPQGEALVLGTDGALHVIDAESGEVTEEVPVVEAWEEPLEWQEPRPTVFVHGQFGFVTEPASNEIHIVDLDNMQVIDSAELPEVPNEVSGVSGDLETGDEGGHHEDGEHDHEHDEEGHTS
ncbi:putative secreted protein [Serinicoccus hydrothermalis]|uniref:Putative secreted protein n=1 Tax=Serinicoccus hydrothermalis TaxID=1758689 RepID=A0A1B1NBZ4_9MICO|nr:zinc metallochaperone AztD [Serinicoccus hydrothermalis]ANS78946.1 putative secreted protein [Serinicoccus hydrothermalis]